MTPVTSLGRSAVRRTRWSLLAAVLATVTWCLAAPPPATAAGTTLAPAVAAPGDPDLGPDVYVFDPSMAVTDIQATVDAVSAQQVGNQFGTERVALLFKPGTYGSAAQPLNFQVGYYTEVAGLGRSPGDVVINGSVDVYNQCDNGSCIALNNFWRSMSNLTINVTNPGFGCYTGEFWAVSQAAPMRRVHVDGLTTLMDYCTGPSFASGGFIADSQFTGGTVINGSQQQFYVRNTALDGWTNGVWNQVFSGDTGAPAECFPADASCGGPYTTLATTPASREKPISTSMTPGPGGSSCRLRRATPRARRGQTGPPRAGPSRCPPSTWRIRATLSARSTTSCLAAVTSSSAPASTTSPTLWRSSGRTPSSSASGWPRSRRSEAAPHSPSPTCPVSTWRASPSTPDP